MPAIAVVTVIRYQLKTFILNVSADQKEAWVKKIFMRFLMSSIA